MGEMLPRRCLRKSARLVCANEGAAAQAVQLLREAASPQKKDAQRRLLIIINPCSGRGRCGLTDACKSPYDWTERVGAEQTVQTNVSSACWACCCECSWSLLFGSLYSGKAVVFPDQNKSCIPRQIFVSYVRPILEAAGFHLDVRESKGPRHASDM